MVISGQFVVGLFIPHHPVHTPKLGKFLNEISFKV